MVLKTIRVRTEMVHVHRSSSAMRFNYFEMGKEKVGKMTGPTSTAKEPWVGQARRREPNDAGGTN